MRSSWDLLLPYPSPPLSLNKRMHWRVQASWAKQLHHDVIMLAMHQHLPKDQARAKVTLVWHPSDKRRRDTDNPVPTLKACIDGLVKYRLIPDDSSHYVTSSVEILPPMRPARLVLRIEVEAP